MSFKKKIITSHIKLITKMKVRNLLLASLAVAAMTACSNENDETVDNGQVQGTENAVIRLGISYPTVTRANTEDGLTEEQIFRTAKVIVNGDVHTYVYDDFEPSTSENALYLKKGIPVAAGPVQVYVFLNLKENLTTPYANMIASASYDDMSGLDGLKEYIAKSGEFLMSNAEGKVATGNVDAGEEATVRINVERAAAKLMEQSQTSAFTIPSEKYGDKTLNITLKEYSFINLQKDTYVLANTNTLTPNFFQEYDANNDKWNYITKTIVGNIQNVEETANKTDNITYCLENKDANKNTCVVYEAVATWDNAETPTTFYVAENVVYSDFESLANEYGDILTKHHLTDKSTAADFRKAGILIDMYEDGKCYYKADIYTNNANNKTIVRNNVYKLNVSSITKLGDPTPTPTPDAASLKIEVKVLPWAINLVDIIL